MQNIDAFNPVAVNPASDCLLSSRSICNILQITIGNFRLCIYNVSQKLNSHCPLYCRGDLWVNPTKLSSHNSCVTCHSVIYEINWVLSQIKYFDTTNPDVKVSSSVYFAVLSVTWCRIMLHHRVWDALSLLFFGKQVKVVNTKENLISPDGDCCCCFFLHHEKHGTENF